MTTETVKVLRATFRDGRTKSIAFRVEQLNALKRLVVENAEMIMEALKSDLGKCKMESVLIELDLIENDINDAIKNVYNWSKPEYVHKTLLYKAMSCYIHKEPLGVVLIIGAWNYPIQLTLLPLIGAIVAGNCAIVKPSEVSPKTAEALEQLIPKYLDNDCYRVVVGGVTETTELLEQKFDKIFYTGSGNVGRIVMAAAAKHLTPVALELGGKSPTYVADDADLKVSANRIVWAKLLNCGQTCVAPDFIMCSKEIQEPLAEQLKETIEAFYGRVVADSPDYGKIVNERHFDRLEALLSDVDDIFFGGLRNKDERFFSPTILLNVKTDARCMQEEIFGPILPIIPVESEDEALEYVLSQPKPLSLYVFSNSGETIQKWRCATTSGMFAANDACLQGGLPTLPFGGVGASGMGTYHGKFSFDCFTHQKSCLEAPVRLVEGANHKMRYPPYSDKKLEWARWVISGKGGVCNIL